MNKPVKVTQINDTRDPEIVRLTLEQEVPQKTAIGILMKGHPRVGGSKRVTWVPAQRANLSDLGLDLEIPEGGLELTPEAMGAETVELVVKESFTPNSWVGADGEVQLQQPKVKPMADGDNLVILVNGKPIFRNVLLSVNGEHGSDEIISISDPSIRRDIPMSEYENSEIKLALEMEASEKINTQITA